MARHVLLALLCAASCVGAVASRASDAHPVDKVISMLQGLIERVGQDGKAEEVTYAKFEHWCKTSESALKEAIATEKSKIDALTDLVAAKTKRSEVLEAQIAESAKQIQQLTNSNTESQAQRETASGLYGQTEADLQATIVAIDDAIAALSETKSATTSLVRSRVQTALGLAGALATEEQRGVLSDFLQQAPAAAAAAAPSPPPLQAEGDRAKHEKKYAFKSHNVIELLKELKAKFEEQKLEATKAETNSMNAFELATQSRQATMQAAETSKATDEQELGEVQGALNDAKNSLESEKAELEADSEALANTQKSCALKASEWSERSTVRAGELEAMEAAIKILAKVTRVRTEAPSNPVPPPSPVSFLQLSGNDPAARALRLLRQEAAKTHSHALERLAQEVSSHLTGPFDDVNNMIQKMIFHLMDEQKDEDNHKNWCDLELEKSNTSRVDKEDKMAELSSKINDARAKVAVLTAEIADDNSMISTIQTHMKEATEIRETGKQENAQSAKDAQDAQAALANAVAVLESFYKDSGMVAKESWEFVQRGVDLPGAPSTWESGYTGVADPKAQPEGIIATLKTVAAGFAKMEADTRAQEETDQKMFEEEMKASAIEKTRRMKSSEMKEQEMKRQSDKAAALESTKKHVSGEHEAVVQYLKDLEHACVDGDSTYDQRRAARTEEIDALKEAQSILAEAFAAPAPAEPASFLRGARTSKSLIPEMS
eukprot:CAMPEP_0170596472 /NCGR_PEP_ID=MMETSP0224-20130122/15141_1 /TAXON_ID=285029 /ORGANISM="Togula jolla, Strain CCCM 725" /LENGTH=718 /DNA_ID=CAMNT_0010920777 /DNA_START=40 /DNA_END=2196 /DNA_ORIENTATION=+